MGFFTSETNIVVENIVEKLFEMKIQIKRRAKTMAAGLQMGRREELQLEIWPRAAAADLD